MSGLVKPKKYDWKDSNIALFGSDLDKGVKKEAAETEPAWKGAGQKVELKIWRIVKFQVEAWPKEDYGKFFSGDSYIILNTYKPDPDNEELAWDLHFWIGSKSTQDEYGTAAYKTVELDTLLEDGPVQHREVQNYESDLFRSYFKHITIMQGGAETGFRHVKPEEYKPRLLHFRKEKKRGPIRMIEVPCCKSRLRTDDVFILDLGKKIYQWNGTKSSNDERFAAGRFMTDLKTEHGGADTETFKEEKVYPEHDFFKALTEEEDEEDEDEVDEGRIKLLHRVSDETGNLSSKLVKDEDHDGKITLADFESKDVFMLDCGDQMFVWVGKDASPTEKKNGFTYATNYLMKTNHPLIPVAVIKQGFRTADFESALAA